MRIALFGGGFDPPHVGHQFIAQTLLDRDIAEEVWYVPVKHHHFGKQVSPDEHRLAMLELILPPGDSRQKIETYELSQTGINYTFDTLEHLSRQYPQHQFSFVIGSDNLSGFHRWLSVHPMLLKYPFYVYPRKGFPMEPWYKGMIALQKVKEVQVSSSQIRELVQAGKPITDLVDPQVEAYIKEHHLYVT